MTKQEALASLNEAIENCDKFGGVDIWHHAHHATLYEASLNAYGYITVSTTTADKSGD